MIDYMLLTFLGVLFSIPVIAITAPLIIHIHNMMVEYAYTFNNPEEVIEHRRINLKLFYIRLENKIYNRKKFNYIFSPWGWVFNLPRGKTASYWIDKKGYFSFSAERRIKEYQESRKPDLRIVS